MVRYSIVYTCYLKVACYHKVLYLGSGRQAFVPLPLLLLQQLLVVAPVRGRLCLGLGPHVGGGWGLALLALLMTLIG